MRRPSLPAAALFAVAAILPAEAQAAPQVVGFVASAFGAGGAFAAGTGLAAGAAAGTAFFGTAVGQLVLGVGLSLVSRALAPRPQQPTPADRMANFAQPISYAETVYGRARKGGPVGFTGFVKAGYWQNDSDSRIAGYPAGASPAGWTRYSNDKRRRFWAPILAAHPIEGVVTHYLDERAVTLGADGWSDTGPTTNYARVTVYDGAAGQAADETLVNVFAGWTTAHDMAGLSYAVLMARKASQEDFARVYPNGRQWDYTPVIDGHNGIPDPRGEGAISHTANAALVLNHWITEGLGRDGLTDAELSAEAAACDVEVSTRYEGARAKWEINGILSDEQDFEQQRAQLAAACDAFFYETPDGRIGFRVGRYTAPTVTLTESDFFTLEITEGQWGANAPTEVVPTYIEPENAWRQSPGGEWVIEAADIPRREEPQLFLVASHNQAARVAKRIAKALRPKYAIRASLGMIGYDLIGERFLRVTHSELGIDEVVEVARLTRDGPALFSLEAQTVEPADFDFDHETEEPERPALGAAAPEAVADVELSPVATPVISTSGDARVRISWGDIEDDETVAVRYREVGASEWLTVHSAAGASEIELHLPDKTDMEIQTRLRSGALNGFAGPWAPDPALAFSSQADPTAPGAIASVALATNLPTLGLVAGGGLGLASGAELGLYAEAGVLVQWETPNDDHHAATRIYRASYAAGTSSFLFADAASVRVDQGAPAIARQWADSGRTAGVHVYWLESLNRSGVAGVRSGPHSIELF